MSNVISFLKEILKHNSQIVIATSGGPDSMCLLDILLKLKLEYNLEIVIAHVNHNLRSESKEEKEFVENIAHNNNCSFEVCELNNLPKTNTEEIARIKRYEFFETVINKYNASILFTAHHADDLIETILMRLTRGSNLSGYKGFKKITNKNNYQIIRPLIYVNKEEIINYNKTNNILYCLDKSNDSDNYTRNRFRKNILPFLYQENPKVYQKFLKFSEELDLIDTFLDKNTNSILTTIYDFDKVNLRKFKELDYVLQLSVIDYMLKNVYQDNIILINDTHKKLIFNLINNKYPSKKINLPLNKVLVKNYNELKFENKDILKPKEYILEDYVKLNDFSYIEKIESTDIEKSNYILRLNSKEVTFPLKIRTKKQGDKILIKNMKYPKKLKDIFINEKIPIDKREEFLVVTDATDAILWLPGLKKSNFDKNNNEFYDIIYKYVVSEEKK